jgi:hypothetical protein
MQSLTVAKQPNFIFGLAEHVRIKFSCCSEREVYTAFEFARWPEPNAGAGRTVRGSVFGS